MNFIGNLSVFEAAKELCESIKNWHSYVGGSLFWLTV